MSIYRYDRRVHLALESIKNSEISPANKTTLLKYAKFLEASRKSLPRQDKLKIVVESKVLMCPRCGSPNSPEATLCLKCKSVLRVQDAVSFSAVEKKLEEQDKAIEMMQASLDSLGQRLKELSPPDLDLIRRTLEERVEFWKNLKDSGLMDKTESK